MDGKSLLVWSEQGIGENLLFFSMLPDLVAVASDITIECDARLIPLCSRSFPTIHWITSHEFACLEQSGREFDRHVMGCAMGQRFRPDLASFPRRSSYLVVDPEQRDAMRNRYLGNRQEGVLVGIAWHSRKSRIFGARKSIDLMALRPVLTIQGVVLVDLQYGDTHAERAAFTAETGIPILHDDAIDQLVDLDRFAAQVAAMDHVVTISNTTAHLAGALGVSTLLMLAKVPLWYWMMEGDASPWYPSLRIFRQKEENEWQEVIDRVAMEMARRVGRSGTPSQTRERLPVESVRCDR